MALFLLPTALGENKDVDSQLTFGAAHLSGRLLGDKAETRLFLPPDVAKHATFTISASQLIVNWTDVGRYHVMDPRNLSRPEVNLQKGPTTQGERNHGHATASADLLLDTSNLMALGLGTFLPMGGFDARTATVTPNPHGQWVGGSRSRETAGQPDPNGTIVRVALPEATSQTEISAGSIRIAGHVTIHVWDTWLNVTDGQGTTTYQAGWRPFENAAAPVAPVRESESRLLSLYATDAEIVITLQSGSALLVSPTSTISAIGEAHLTSALGTINDHLILDETVDVRGEFRLVSTNRSAGDDHLRGTLTYRADVTAVKAGQTQIVAPASPDRPVSPWWFAVASVPILLVGTVAGIRRYRPVTLADVEYAILSGHDRRARRSARRLVTKTPSDPDAVFLYATTLLQRKEFTPLLETIEPLAAMIPKPDRRGIAFVLAVASHAVGDKKRSAKWGAEAAREPLLAQKLEEGGVGSFKVGPSRFAQSGYA